MSITRNVLYPALLAIFSVLVAPQMAAAADEAESVAGETLTLTKKEAEGWKLRPVYTTNGEKVGKLAKVTLSEDGKIEKITVSSEAEETGKVTVPADQFAIEGQRIVLDVDRSAFKEMASNSQ